jgi:hypothetical protein
VGLLLRLAKNTAKLKLKCGLAGSRVRETGPGLPPSAFCLRASDVEWSPERHRSCVVPVGSLRGPGVDTDEFREKCTRPGDLECMLRMLRPSPVTQPVVHPEYFEGDAYFQHKNSNSNAARAVQPGLVVA